MNDMNDMHDMHMLRGNCFKLLAACFYEPDKELFLQEGLCENLAALLAACACEEAARAAGLMREALAEQDDEALKVEYARLFVGPFELIAPPYGSVYLEKGRRLMGDSTLAVQKMYEEFDLSLAVKEVPDHIALELEFMHYLYMCEADAAARAQSGEVARFAAARAGFMDRFLGPWVPNFCKDIKKGTDNRFYSLLADSLAGFVAGTATVQPHHLPA